MLSLILTTVGTTEIAGFNTSQDVLLVPPSMLGLMHHRGTTTDNGGGSSHIEDDPSKLAKHIEQFELSTTWNTVECSLSVNKRILSSARKYVGKQIQNH